MSIFLPAIPKGKPINYFNTWEAADAFRQEILSDDDQENARQIELAWNSAMDFSWEHQLFSDGLTEEMDWLEFRNRYRNTLTPAEALARWVGQGSIPPPELLYCVSQCLSVYMHSAFEEETTTLEDVFFGPLKKGKGNHAKSALSSTFGPPYEEFHKFLQNITDGDSLYNTPQESLAEIFFDEREKKYKKLRDMCPTEVNEMLGIKASDRATREPPDIDTFLRNYRRWKNNNKSRTPADN